MLRESVTLGRVFGVRIELSFSWFLVFIALVWSLGGVYFPLRYPLWPAMSTWGAAFLATGLFFLGVLLHELAHALVAKSFRVPVSSISLFIFGGVAQFERDAPSPRAELLISLAGPATSLLLGILGVASALVFSRAPEPIGGLFWWLGTVNLALGVFNLLPSFPLDGGRALRAIAWFVSEDVQWSNRVALRSGQYGAFALFLAGFYMIITQHGGITNAIWIMLVGWFLNTAASANYQTSVLRTMLSQARVAELMVSRLGRVSESDLLRFPTQELFSMWGPEFFVVAREQGDSAVFAMSELQTSLSELSEQDTAPDARQSVIERLLVRLSPDQVILESASAADAVSLFINDERQWAPVLSEGSVTGIIRRIDVAEYIARARRSA
jgi:Zn-dependent protease